MARIEFVQIKAEGSNILECADTIGQDGKFRTLDIELQEIDSLFLQDIAKAQGWHTAFRSKTFHRDASDGAGIGSFALKIDLATFFPECNIYGLDVIGTIPPEIV
jgi:hypothetical protein